MNFLNDFLLFDCDNLILFVEKAYKSINFKRGVIKAKKFFQTFFNRVAKIF